MRTIDCSEARTWGGRPGPEPSGRRNRLHRDGTNPTGPRLHSGPLL